MRYLTGLMAALCCGGACRGYSAAEATYVDTQARSLAGEGQTETPKAKADSTKVGVTAKPVVGEGSGPQSHLDYCHTGFRPTGDPERDVVRLGALCGPSNGLVERLLLPPELRLGVRSGDGSDSVVVDAPRSLTGCGVLVLGRPLGGALVSVSLLDKADVPLAQCQLRESGLCPEGRLVCEPAKVALSYHAGDPPDSGTETPSSGSSDEGESIILRTQWWSLPQGVRPEAPATASGLALPFSETHN